MTQPLLKTPSLHLTRPVGRTLLKGLFLLVLFLAAVEGLARIDFIQERFPRASLGGYHTHFEVKWFKLQEYVEEHGGVDVILMGSSLVNTGVVPEEVSRAFLDNGGDTPLRVFNFGVEGLTIQPNATVAQLLIETYQPKAIIFGTELRDYAANNGVEVAEQFLTGPWVQYRRGVFSPRGWLAEHSYAARYYLAYRNWMTCDFPEDHAEAIHRQQIMQADGYDIENRISVTHNRPPDPANPEDAEVFEVFAGFEIDPGRLGDLQSLIAAGQQNGVIVIFVEMPVAPTFFDYFERGELEHDNFLRVIPTQVAESGGYFIPAPPEDIFPLNGRSDRVHLNKFGAPFLSRYLGEQLAALAAAEGLNLAHPEKGD